MAENASRARIAWGGDPPDWIAALAAECDARRSQTQVAKRLGYSGPVINAVLGNKYAGDLARVEAAVRGALLGETVECPVLAAITRDRCLAEQARPLEGTNALRAPLWRACRSGCPHSRITKGGN